MYLYFLRVVFTVVKVVKVSSQSFSHRFIVICICPTKVTCDAYFCAPSFLKNAPQERQDESVFFTTKKYRTIKFRRVPPQKTENLSSSSFKSHAFDFIRFSRLCLSPLLARLFQNRYDHDDVHCDDVFVDDFSSLLFREEAFTIGTSEEKN